jgi:Tfp pilus assembly protein PilF
LEEQLRKEKEKGKKVTGKGIFEPGTVTDTAEDADTNVRKKSDKDIEKFNRLVMDDRSQDIKSSYQDDIRGRVQDRQVKVDLEPQFVLTYYEKISDQEYLSSLSDSDILEYNTKVKLHLQLKITNKEAALTDQQAQYHFSSIDEFSLLLDRNALDADAYFGRALDFMVLQDLSESMDDLDRAIQLNPDFFLAYFNRAVIRYKMMQLDVYEEENVNMRQDIMNLSLNIQPNNHSQQTTVNPYSRLGGENPDVLNSGERKRMFDLDQIMRDYEKVIEINPDFVYAYFNRANIRCLRKDFRTAIVDYSEVIKMKPNFAEAYYNRGLTRLYLGDTEKGIADLSKAGELGMVSAYSIIKSMND